MSLLNDIIVIDNDLIKKITGFLSTPSSLLSSNEYNIYDIKTLDFNDINGKIRRIENLDSYTSLTRLDLSFHTISHIDGLSSLSLLKELNLSGKSS